MRIALVLVLVMASTSVLSQTNVTQRLSPNVELAFNAAKVDESQVQVTPTQAEMLDGVIVSIQNGAEDAAVKQWQALVASKFFESLPLDVNALVQWVIRESYLTTADSLRDQADKVRFFADQKKSIRRALNRARTYREQLQAKFKPTDFVDIQIDHLLNCLTKTEHEAELANIDLQDSLQKVQETLQLMSNMSKLLHAAALSTIRSVSS